MDTQDHRPLQEKKAFPAEILEPEIAAITKGNLRPGHSLERLPSLGEASEIREQVRRKGSAIDLIPLTFSWVEAHLDGSTLCEPDALKRRAS